MRNEQKMIPQECDLQYRAYDFIQYLGYNVGSLATIRNQIQFDRHDYQCIS